MSPEGDWERSPRNKGRFLVFSVSGREQFNPRRGVMIHNAAMDNPALSRRVLLLLLGLAFSACAAGPRLVVHKDPYCGCCNAWIEHMRQAGFPVEARNENDMGPVKARAGVPL